MSLYVNVNPGLEIFVMTILAAPLVDAPFLGNGADSGSLSHSGMEIDVWSVHVMSYQSGKVKNQEL